MNITKLCIASAVSALMGTAAQAQATAPTATPMPSTGAKMTPADCEKLWMDSDVNKDGVMSESEGARFYAAQRFSNKPLTSAEFTRDTFLTNCQSGMYLQTTAETGAPFKGANSFTENQAKDRAASYGFTDLTTLQKDSDGIWRGSAVQSGKKGTVAIDYKGNVVFN